VGKADSGNNREVRFRMTLVADRDCKTSSSTRAKQEPANQKRLSARVHRQTF